MLAQQPDGTALGPLGETIAADDNTERADHTGTALGRLIDRWRADQNPNLAALVSSTTSQIAVSKSRNSKPRSGMWCCRACRISRSERS